MFEGVFKALENIAEAIVVYGGLTVLVIVVGGIAIVGSIGLYKIIKWAKS